MASIVILGKACDLIDHHHELKKTDLKKTATVSSSSPNKKKTDTSSTWSSEKSSKATVPASASARAASSSAAVDNSIQDNDSMTSGASMVASAAEASVISEDMAILEAKLQTIDGDATAGNCTTYSHPNTPPHTVSFAEFRRDIYFWKVTFYGWLRRTSIKYGHYIVIQILGF